MLSARTPTRFLTGLLASGSLVVALTASPARSVPLPKPRPQSMPAKAGTTPSAPAAAPQAAARPARSALAPSDLPPAADIAALKEAIAAARRGKTTQAADLQKTISDPVARKLVEWQILRSDDTQSIDVSRYMAFITENPSWPSTALMRRRAAPTLWADRLGPAPDQLGHRPALDQPDQPGAQRVPGRRVAQGAAAGRGVHDQTRVASSTSC